RNHAPDRSGADRRCVLVEQALGALREKVMDPARTAHCGSVNGVTLTTEPSIAAKKRSTAPPPLAYARAADLEQRPPGRWRARDTQRLLAFVAICMISVGFLLPFVWMVSTSLKTLNKTMEYPPHFIPDRVELHGNSLIPENYWRVVTHDKMDFP